MTFWSKLKDKVKKARSSIDDFVRGNYQTSSYSKPQPAMAGIGTNDYKPTSLQIDNLIANSVSTPVSTLEDSVYDLVGRDFPEEIKSRERTIDSMDEYHNMDAYDKAKFVEKLFNQFNKLNKEDRAKFTNQSATWKMGGNTYEISKEVIDGIFYEQENFVKEDVINEYNRLAMEGDTISHDERVDLIAKNFTARFAGKDRKLNKQVVERLLNGKA